MLLSINAIEIRFAAFFIDARAKRSVVESCIDCVLPQKGSHLGLRAVPFDVSVEILIRGGMPR
jgi:hypothetical protein